MIPSLKVVHLNTSYGVSGAGIAARRLHLAMLSEGWNSAFVAASFYLGMSAEINRLFFPEEKTLRRNKLRFLLQSQVERFLRKRGALRPELVLDSAYCGFHVDRLPAVKNADIIYLHWVNDGFLSIRAIEHILRLGKPTYWVMHDMWPLTGGCHYDLSCNKFTERCGMCPMLKNPGIRDLSFRNFRRKFAAWHSYPNLHVITPSEWLEKQARQSPIFSNHDVQTIHNILDWRVFKPIPTNIAREVLNLPQDKYLLLFGADGGTTNPYKGWQYLLDALNRSALKNTEIIVFGSEHNQKIVESLKYKVHFLGRLGDETSLVIAYNACDLLVTPSLADNWPSTILEAHCCGKPVLAFNTGGIPYMIQHEVDGWLAATRDTESLVNGLIYCQSKKWDADKICETGRSLVDKKDILQKHSALWMRDFPNMGSEEDK